MRIEVRRTIEQEFKADGWRRCAEGQGETQFCAMLEAAVLAEREACAELCDKLAKVQGRPGEIEHWQQGYHEGANMCARKIRARGQHD